MRVERNSEPLNTVLDDVRFSVRFGASGWRFGWRSGLKISQLTPPRKNPVTHEKHVTDVSRDTGIEKRNSRDSREFKKRKNQNPVTHGKFKNIKNQNPVSHENRKMESRESRKTRYRVFERYEKHDTEFSRDTETQKSHSRGGVYVSVFVSVFVSDSVSVSVFQKDASRRERFSKKEREGAIAHAQKKYALQSEI